MHMSQLYVRVTAVSVKHHTDSLIARTSDHLAGGHGLNSLLGHAKCHL